MTLSPKLIYQTRVTIFRVMFGLEVSERAQVPHALRTTDDWHLLVLVVFFWSNMRVEEYWYEYNSEVSC